jgi:hypothetical protein
LAFLESVVTKRARTPLNPFWAPESLGQLLSTVVALDVGPHAAPLSSSVAKAAAPAARLESANEKNAGHANREKPIESGFRCRSDGGRGKGDTAAKTYWGDIDGGADD